MKKSVLHIYKKYTCLHYGTYLLFRMDYTKSVSFIDFSMDCSIMMTFMLHYNLDYNYNQKEITLNHGNLLTYKSLSSHKNVT